MSQHKQSQAYAGPALGPALYSGGTLPTRNYHVRSAPLLWLVLPFASGIGFAYNFLPNLPVAAMLSPATVLALLAAALVFIPSLERLKCNTALWAVLFCLAAFLCGAAYALLREPPRGPYLEVPREATLTLRAERLFAANRADGFVSGIATVLDAPAYLPEMTGQKVAFSVWTNSTFLRDQPPLLNTSEIIIRGRLTDFNAPPLQRKDRAAQRQQRNSASAQNDADSGRTAANASTAVANTSTSGRGEVQANTTRDNEGFRTFLRSQGVRYGIDSGSILTVTDAGSTWRQLCARIKARLQTALNAGADSEETQRLANIGTAMLLGDTSLLPVNDRSAFTVSGTMHLFAVSGLHVVLIAAAFAAAGELCGLRRSRVALAGIILLWVYVQVVGAPPSATRAWWMSSLFWAAVSLRRQHSPLSALCASMFIILLISPRDLLAAGFQLSYSVVAGILLYALPLSASIENWTQQRLDAAHLRLRRFPLFPPRPWYMLRPRQRRSLLTLFTISLVGTLYSTPLVLGIFGNFAPAGLLVNLLLVPLSFWVLCALLLACAFGLPGLLWPAALFNHAAWLLLAFMSWVAGLTLLSPAGFYTGLAWRWPYYGAVGTILLLAASFACHSSVFAKWAWLKFSILPLLWLVLLFAGLA